MKQQPFLNNTLNAKISITFNDPTSVDRIHLTHMYNGKNSLIQYNDDTHAHEPKIL